MTLNKKLKKFILASIKRNGGVIIKRGNKITVLTRKKKKNLKKAVDLDLRKKFNKNFKKFKNKTKKRKKKK